MKNKGFIATSIIYSFLIVFLMLLTTILITTRETRILTSSVKEDIKESLLSYNDLKEAIKEIETGASLPKSVTFANESWTAVKIENRKLNEANDQTNSKIVTLVLNRALTEKEIVLASGYNSSIGALYDTPSSTNQAIKVSACANTLYSIDQICYHLGANYSKQLYMNKDKITSIALEGESFVHLVLEGWYKQNEQLRKAEENGFLHKLKYCQNGTVDDACTEAEPNKVWSYVRIPTYAEASLAKNNTEDFKLNDFHLFSNTNLSSGKNTYIYKGSTQSSEDTTTKAFIVPVIEVTINEERRITNYIEDLSITSSELKKETTNNNIYYVGEDPKNFVYYNCDYYRIIGMVNVENAVTNTTERRVKLIKAEPLGYDKTTGNVINLVINNNNKSSYANSDLYYYLNQQLFNTVSATCPRDDIPSSDCFSKKYKTITDGAYDNMLSIGITFRNFNNGLADANTKPANEVYASENKAANSLKNGFMFIPSLSDYLYSLSSGKSYIKKMASSYAVRFANTNGNNQNYVLDSSGNIISINANQKSAIYPVVYLNNNVDIVGGKGTKENPYLVGHLS